MNSILDDSQLLILIRLRAERDEETQRLMFAKIEEGIEAAAETRNKVAHLISSEAMRQARVYGILEIEIDEKGFRLAEPRLLD